MKTPLDPTRTYTQLPPDAVFPFEAIDQFRAWHDSAMNALKLKDQKIEQLESRIRQMDEDTRDSWTNVLQNLEEARKQLAEALGGLAPLEEMSKAAMQLHLEVGRLQQELSSQQIPFPYTKFGLNTDTSVSSKGTK